MKDEAESLKPHSQGRMEPGILKSGSSFMLKPQPYTIFQGHIRVVVS